MMRRIFLFMLVVFALNLSAKDLGYGSVVGINFGEKMSKFKKIKGIKCEKNNAGYFCRLDKQKIIDDDRIETINFYFDSKKQLYGVKFISPEDHYLFAFPKQCKEDVAKLLSFFDQLPVTQGKLLKSSKARTYVVYRTSDANVYFVSRIFYNTELTKVAEKEDDNYIAKKKQEEEKKRKNLKAKF